MVHDQASDVRCPLCKASMDLPDVMSLFQLRDGGRCTLPVWSLQLGCHSQRVHMCNSRGLCNLCFCWEQDRAKEFEALGCSVLACSTDTEVGALDIGCLSLAHACLLAPYHLRLYALHAACYAVCLVHVCTHLSPALCLSCQNNSTCSVLV